jgi:3-oxoacyl-[acyl-carrier-protein] synthase II
MKERVVISGLGVISSIGIGKDEFWRNLIAGKTGISKITSFDTSQYFVHKGGEIKTNFAQYFLTPKQIHFLGRTTQLALAATKLALDDAGLSYDKLSKYKVGVVLGTTTTESCLLESLDKTWIKEGIDKLDKFSILLYPANTLSTYLAMEFNLGGRNLVLPTACSAGNYALGYSFDLIREKRADLVIAGGVDGFSKIAFTGFARLGAVAPQLCQPFDKNRQGMMVGEGAGILIVESLKSALKRGAHIYAEIIGYGLSCDAFSMLIPDSKGIACCIEKALAEAKVKKEEVDYISAHGTGTIQNDKEECLAIKKVFGAGYKKIPISSIKSMLGHCMGASSAIEAVACCLTLKNDIIPPTINYQTPDPECDIDCVPNKAREQKVNIALNNSYAFGGNNACLVLKKLIYT